MSKDEQRLERQRAIAELAKEMVEKEPVFISNSQISRVEGYSENEDDEPAYDSESDDESEADDIDNDNVNHASDFSKVKRQDENNKSVDEIDDSAQRMKIPISHQVELGGHTKAVSTISYEPSGNRIITGSLDYSLKIFDFGGMDLRHRAFKSIEVEDGYPVIQISHSPTGDRFIVATGSAQPKIYDREGEFVIQFCKGDMYLRDLANTKGHTMEVTGAQWHPKDKDTVLTSSLDGSLRIWYLPGEALFGKLINKAVLKIRSATGQQRLGATCCAYSFDGSMGFGGAADGSVQMWYLNNKKTFSKPDLIWRTSHTSEGPVTCVRVMSDNSVFASRYSDGSICLWNLKAKKVQSPLRVFDAINNVYSTSNLDFSPDNQILVCGTSPPRENKQMKSMLVFFDLSSLLSSSSSSLTSSSVDQQQQQQSPCLQIAVVAGGSVIHIQWIKKTNQIFVTTSLGYTRVYFDPRLSIKGALLTASRAPRREKDPLDVASIGQIYNPHALPLFREEVKGMRKRERHGVKKVDPKAPTRPSTQGPGRTQNNSFFFTQYVMEGRKVDTSRTEDPREALLKLDEEAKRDPKYLGEAYAKTQPVTTLLDKTFEEEREEFKKRQRT